MNPHRQLGTAKCWPGLCNPQTDGTRDASIHVHLLILPFPNSKVLPPDMASEGTEVLQELQHSKNLAKNFRKEQSRMSASEPFLKEARGQVSSSLESRKYLVNHIQPHLDHQNH